MRFFTTLLTTTALLSTTALSAPLIAASRTAAFITEDAPWQLSNIVIFEAATANGTNSTRPSTVNFDIKDINPGLEFSTHCSRTVARGESLYDETYRRCGDSSLGLAWYLDAGKNIYIQRGWTDPAVGGPGQDYVTCFGNWGLNPHPFEVRNPRWTGPLQGTNFTQGCLEIYCTAMTA